MITDYYKNFDFRTATKLIKYAIEEDCGSGDVTSDNLIKKQKVSTAVFKLKEHGVIAGLEIIKIVFGLVDPKIRMNIFVNDGELYKKGTIIASLKGNTRNLLKGERLSLNILQRMSGIATASFSLKKRLGNTDIKIIDTRKTTPNFRIFEKLAVKIGGCENHRFGLYDMILIKDNHINANGGIIETLKILKNKKNLENFKKEIEVTSVNEFIEVKKYGRGVIDIVMLDNFKISDIRKVVKLNKKMFLLEVSGGVNHTNISRYGKINGINYISVGALTHSVRSLDISLDFVS